MNTKKLLSFLLAFMLIAVTYAQDDIEEIDLRDRSNEIGMHAGFTTGMGLSYRHWSGKFGVQLTAIPIKAQDFQFISGGLTGLYSLTNKKYYRFFLYLGNHILISDETFGLDGTTDVTTMYNIGFGPGFEVGTKVRFNIMVGYAGYDLLDAPDYSLLPTIEMGLFFKL
jgi:hypothetical protein